MSLIAVSCFSEEELMDALQFHDVKVVPEASNLSWTFNQQLFHHFGINPSSPLPIAALTATIDELPPAFYLRADPISLQVDWMHVYMLGNDYLEITSEEMHQIANLLNQHLSSYDLQLITPHPRRWYLKLTKPVEISTQEPDMLIGKSIIDYFAHGEQQIYWKKIFNELQMLLHDCAVNQKRQQHRFATIDALWFWGGGDLSTLTRQQLPWKKIITNDAVAAGLARWSGCELQTLSSDLRSWQNNISDRDQELQVLRIHQSLEESESSLQNMSLLIKKIANHLPSTILYINNQCYGFNLSQRS